VTLPLLWGVSEVLEVAGLLVKASEAEPSKAWMARTDKALEVGRQMAATTAQHQTVVAVVELVELVRILGKALVVLVVLD
jgi:hypothetical protein